MTDETRILSGRESAQRRSEQAASGPRRSVVLCAEEGCPRAAAWGPYCNEHRRVGFQTLVAPDLSASELAEVKAKVAADAAPLFVLAIRWIAQQQMVRLGLELPEGLG